MIRRRWIPSTSALLAFESAARHRNFSRAAEELNTSQSAISRHIAALEERLAARLFERQGPKLDLTVAGDQYHRAVLSGLETIQNAAMTIASATGDHLTLACTHEVSHLFLMPRFEALQAVVGETTRVHIMTLEYDAMEMLADPRIDLVLTYDGSGAAPGDRVVALDEAVRPVCAPAFAREHRTVLERDVTHWGGLPFLTMTRRNLGWATWEDWFGEAGQPAVAPTYVGLDNYVYLLEAAAAGRGIVLGWRGMVERYLESGTLIALGDRWVTYDRPFYAKLTRHGRERPAARRCLAFFEQPAAGPERRNGA